MRYFLLFFALADLAHARAQAPDTLSYPEVGKPMPDLVVKNIAYYPKKQADIRHFRGKWLLLDFWDVHCGACVRSFPHMNRIQQAFSNRLQVMLVGVQDPDNQIQPLFAKYRERLHLAIPCAFDSTLANRLDLGYMPHTIVIDDKGIVRSVVSAIDSGQVREFLDGKTPVLRQTYRRMKDYDTTVDRTIPFNRNKPFLVGGNGDNDSAFLFRSVLSIWKPGFHRFFESDYGLEEAAKTGRFQILGAAWEWLYNYAYFGARYWKFEDSLLYGKCFDRPVLEMKESTLSDLSRQYYCYSLIRPAANNSAKVMQEAMQRDLANFFGLRAGIEVRKRPYWKLIAQPGAKEKLRTKGGKTFAYELSPRVGWTVGNCPIADVMNYISGNNPGRDRSTNVYLDETGITGNIDITLDCIMNDLNDLRKALRANGLDLVKGEKEMKVLVIRDGNGN